MRRSSFLLILLLSTLGWRSEASLSVDEIVRRANHAAYYQGQDGRARVTMTIEDRNKNKRQRVLTILRRNESKEQEDQNFYVYFHKPADVSRMVLLAKKHLKSEDERWLYLPSLDLVKRVAASDERTSFVGSDFYYEDVSGRGIDEDIHRLVETTKSYYVLEHTPKMPKSVEFSRYKMWVHRGSFLPTKVEYYDRSGKKYRVMTVEAVETIQGFPTVKKATMASLDAGTKTTLEYSQIRYNVGLPFKLFTERYLRGAPQKYLK